MLSLTESHVLDGALLAPMKPQPRRLALSGLNVLLIEHRDEVFARLQRDLYQLGIGTYRATSPEEVFRVHFRIDIRLTLANSGLPDSSIWLTTAKLHLQDRQARIWAYLLNPTSQNRFWAQLVGIEKVISYDGSLFQLSDAVHHALRGYGALNDFATSKLREAS